MAVIVGLVLFVVVVAVWVAYLRVFNGPDGERYARMRMQGPFAPDPADQPTPQSHHAGTAEPDAPAAANNPSAVPLSSAPGK